VANFLPAFSALFGCGSNGSEAGYFLLEGFAWNRTFVDHTAVSPTFH
jgi:hypothetical protein